MIELRKNVMLDMITEVEMKSSKSRHHLNPQSVVQRIVRGRLRRKRTQKMLHKDVRAQNHIRDHHGHHEDPNEILEPHS